MTNSVNFLALKYTCHDQFMIMSYAQFTDRSSLRDVEATLTVFLLKPLACFFLKT